MRGVTWQGILTAIIVILIILAIVFFMFSYLSSFNIESLRPK